MYKLHTHNTEIGITGPAEYINGYSASRGLHIHLTPSGWTTAVVDDLDHRHIVYSSKFGKLITDEACPKKESCESCGK